MKTPSTLLAALLALATTAVAQSGGSLTPPGAPGLTMKSLDQVEPRIPIVNGAPGVTISGSGNITISASGSYYLTENKTITSGNGITVAASNVTLDLNGFALMGDSSGTTAISSSGYSNFVVSNGFIRGWTNAGVLTTNVGTRVSRLMIYAAGTGLDLNGLGCTVDNCQVMSCTNGIVSDASSTITDCAIYNITSSTQDAYGIYGGVVKGCMVRTVLANGAFNAYGIFGTNVSECSVVNVQSTSGSAGYGINATAISHCSYAGTSSPIASSALCYGMSAQSIHHSTVENFQCNTSASVYGMIASQASDCVVSRCTNTGSGTTVSGIRGDPLSSGGSSFIETSVVRDCNVSGITCAAGSAYGINISGAGVVTGNRVGYCGYRGISLIRGTATGNVTNNCGTGLSLSTGLATGNTSVSDTTAFVFSTGVRCGPTVIGGGVGTTFDPNSNFDM